MSLATDEEAIKFVRVTGEENKLRFLINLCFPGTYNIYICRISIQLEFEDCSPNQLVICRNVFL